jgi:hypothetical protein
MKKAVASAAIAFLVVVACGPFHRLSGFSAVASSSREASPSPAASPSRITLPTPPISTAAPPSVAGRVFSTAPCRVPMSYVTEAKGYFVAYPGGATTPAPGSAIALPGGVPGTIGANPGLTYDVPLRRWVPVPPDWLVPSGTTYVFEDFTAGAIYAVDVRSQAVQDLGKQQGWYIVGTTDTGVFVADSYQPGVWFLSFANPSPAQIAGGQGWTAYDHGALWLQSGPELMRHDLATGGETVVAKLSGWFTLVGFDVDGSPLLKTSNDVPHSDPRQRFALKEIGPKGEVKTLWAAVGEPNDYAVGDAHGVWFELSDGGGIPNAGPSGLYLWTQRHGAVRMNRISLNLMGPCA